MTTGNYLVSISSLATGTAKEHLVNIEGGGGDLYIHSTVHELVEEAPVSIEAVGDIISLAEIDDRIEIVEVEIILEESNDAIY